MNSTNKATAPAADQYPKINAKYKDTVFRLIFNDEKNLLSLYNAVNGTHYENPGDLEITTLENAIFMKYKNDVSCLLYDDLSLYEHQASVNSNMPLRDLFYVTDQLKKMVPTDHLHRSARQMIPTPKFVVFYNGTEKQPEKKEYRLSDSFKNPTPDPQLELKVTQLNINPGYNESLLESCRLLKEYTLFVEKVRHYLSQLDDIHAAVPLAIDECIKEEILEEFLSSQRAEAIAMSIYEYNEENVLRLREKDAYDEGYDEGRKSGYDEGRKNGVMEERQNTEKERQNAEKERLRAEEACKRAEKAEQKVAELLKQLEEKK